MFSTELSNDEYVLELSGLTPQNFQLKVDSVITYLRNTNQTRLCYETSPDMKKQQNYKKNKIGEATMLAHNAN